ncbi:hypothetical protein GJ744_008141 [Endocarpon pusillum]|uniref:NACHT domain-containing protein n=1 Tax=Endocarpon pusillum TaxID=364733 RepID=A0A8H7E4N5_9EURO|nr:hypothetical protein GJ744_008141 [Endocarpon pusillum]
MPSIGTIALDLKLIRVIIIVEDQEPLTPFLYTAEELLQLRLRGCSNKSTVVHALATYVAAMSLPVRGPTDLTLPQPVDRNAASRNPWVEAFKTLDANEQKPFDRPDTDLLGVLKAIRIDTDNNKKRCLEKGWTVYHKNGEEVKLRHVLEKISIWVTELIKVVDAGVSFDKSGQAALPWAVVKYLITAGTNDIAVFSHVSEAVESISGLITRYTVFENLYLHEDCKSTPKLYDSICELYTAILRYLSKAKAYFSGNSLQRFGRGLLEMMRKQYEELWSKITEVDVEKWARLVDVELQRKLAKDTSKRYETLKTTLYKLDQPIMQMADQMSVFQDRLNREERVKIFQWMSKIEYRNHHEDLSKNLLAHSGEWLLQSREYIEWGQSSVSSILWLHGIPGSGKTRLVSIVINHVFEAHSALSAPPIAFFYCARNEAERERAMPVEVMRAILRQLASTKPDMPIKEPVAKEYEERKKKADEDCSSLRQLTVEDCTRLILALTNGRPATIIIDALDECDEDLRYELLDALDEIVSKSVQVVKVFVSSRDDVDIVSTLPFFLELLSGVVSANPYQFPQKLHLERSRNVSISASQNGQDIQRFIESELEQLISKRRLLKGKVSSELRSNIVRVLNKGAQGMFRWVALSLEVLRRIKYEPDFEDALGKLPSTLSELYDEIYEQIEKTETKGRTVAVMTLKWLLCAQRLLSATELIAAITSPENETQSSSESDSVIIELCRNLVTMDSELGVLRFAHQSVREYLQNRPEYAAAELHALATERCLQACMVVPPSSSSLATVFDREHLLRPYAQFYWPIHYKNAEINRPFNLKKNLLPFFLQESRVSPLYTAWAEDIAAHVSSHAINHLLGLDRDDRLGHRLWSASYSPPTPLGAACAFGLQSLMDEFDVLSSTDWIQQLSRFGDTRTLLHIAAEEGENPIVQRLLEKGVSPDSKDETSRTPLSWAAEGGHDAVVKLLLDKGADLELKDDKHGWTPLWWAARSEHEAVVKLLLDNGADLESKDKKYSWTPLLWAVEYRHEAMVKLLLDKGANLESKDKLFGQTPLLRAAAYGHEAVVKLFLDKGADLESKDEEYGWTTLSWAAGSGHEAVVKLLLDKGADLEPKDDKYGWTPLLWAAEHGHEAVVKLLLDKGADLESKDKDYGRTPLSWAAEHGHETVVKLLLDKGADLESKDKRFGWTPLSWAARSGHDAVVKLLLNKGADLESKDKLFGQTPLSWAVAHGHEAVVELLLDKGADLESKDEKFGRTPLSWAAEHGHEAVVKLLLDKGVDLESKDEDGRTPLSWAAGFRTPLSWEARSGHEAVVKLLLDKGADLESKDEDGRTPLSWAAGFGYKVVVKLLLEKGAYFKIIYSSES